MEAGTPGSILHLLAFPFSKHGRRTKVSDAFLLWHHSIWAPWRHAQHVGLLICRQKHCFRDAK